MSGGKGSPAMGCAIMLALLAGGLFVLWACARAVGCGLGVV